MDTQNAADTSGTLPPLPDVKDIGPGPKVKRKAKPAAASAASGGDGQGEGINPGAAGGSVKDWRRINPGRPVRKFPVLKGRPSKLTLRVARRICKFLRRGAPLYLAAEAVGVSKDTVGSWYARGCDESSGPFHVFAINVQRARAIGSCKAISRVTTAGERGVWQADAWKLERQYPSEFGRPQEMRVQHTGQVQHVHAVAYVDVSAFPPGEMSAIGDAIGRMLQAPAIETTAVPVANNGS